MKDFQNYIKLPLSFIQISASKSKFAKNSWKFSKLYRFPLIFRLIFLNIFATLGGASAHPANPLQIHISKIF